MIRKRGEEEVIYTGEREAEIGDPPIDGQKERLLYLPNSTPRLPVYRYVFQTIVKPKI